MTTIDRQIIYNSFYWWWKKTRASTYHELWDGDGVIGVCDQLVSSERHSFPELRGDEQTSRTEQLQAGLGRGDDGQITVDVIDRQHEDFHFTSLFLAHLQKCTPCPKISAPPFQTRPIQFVVPSEPVYYACTTSALARWWTERRLRGHLTEWSVVT